MQRSGSGWFEALLNSHFNVSSNGEIFSIKERRSNISSIIQTLDKVYNLDWFSSALKNQCSAAVDFKWMLNQVIMFWIQVNRWFSCRKQTFLLFTIYFKCESISSHHSTLKSLQIIDKHKYSFIAIGPNIITAAGFLRLD